MGYTHYWQRPRKNAGSAYMFGLLALDAKKIIAYAEPFGVIIKDSNGEGKPNFNESFFAFNGDASEGADHETFLWEGIPTIQDWRQDEPMSFDFCKTAHKPYDAVVTAILIRAKHIYGSCVEVSSDGSWDEWEKGRALYVAVFGEMALTPFGLVKV